MDLDEVCLQEVDPAIQVVEGLEVLAKVSGQESEREEENSRQRELLHGLVLVGSDRVEDQGYQSIRLSLNRVQRFLDQHTVVQHVTKISESHRRDNHTL